MATAVEKAIDVAADAAEIVAEESTDVAVATRSLSPKDISRVGGGVLFGIAIGSFGTHLLLSKVLKKKYEKFADEEIANMKIHYDRKLRALENREEKATLEEVSRDIAIRQEGEEGGGQTPYHTMYKGGSEPDKTPQGETIEYIEATPEGIAEAAGITQNVFINNSDDSEAQEDWDIETELANRSPDVPYVVHRNEHEEGPEGPEEYEKYTLTYFEGDDTLCRDDDTVITDQDEVVGLGNLSRFGHGSGDPNIVYIRNDKLKVDLEVVHSDGRYAQEVAGFKEDELQHSSMKRRSPRRSDFDSDR